MISLNDKKGGATQPQWTFDGFKDVAAGCGLMDLNLEGHLYT